MPIRRPKSLRKPREIQVSIERGEHIEPSKMTLSGWLDIWAAEYLGGVKSSTVYAYKAHIKNHIKPALGAQRLQKVKPHNIQKFYNDLQRNKKLSAKTVKNLHGVLHSALKQAVKIGYLRANPADAVFIPRAEKPEIATLPDSVLPAFLEAIEKNQYGNIIYTALSPACGRERFWD